MVEPNELEGLPVELLMTRMLLPSYVRQADFYEALRTQQLFMLAVLPLAYFGTLCVFSRTFRLGCQSRACQRADCKLSEGRRKA